MLKRLKRHSRKILIAEALIVLLIVIAVIVRGKPAQAEEAKIVGNKGSVIELSWTADEESDRFRIYRTGENGKREFLGRTGNTHYSDTTADPDKTYTYTIVTCDGLRTGEEVKIVYSPSGAATQFRSDAVCFTKEEAAGYLRKAMVSRAEDILIDTAIPDPDVNEIFALAVQHTGDPREGDYLKFQHGTCVARLEPNGDLTSIRYVMSYYSTAEQETEVDRVASEIIGSLDLDGKTDYQKIKAIYEYLRDNIDYDSDSYNDNNIKRTAYAGLVKGKCVCQGYTLSAYRLFLEAGLDSRIIYGTGIPEVGPSGPHTWNIVKCDDRYYYLDITWDDLLKRFRFNLQPKGEFEKTHIGKDEYAEEEFFQEYVISETGYNADAGSIGGWAVSLLSFLKQCKGR